jgi:hypothetical protein
MSGERGDVDKNIVENWKEKLPKLCEGYAPNLYLIWMKLEFSSKIQQEKLFILRMRTVHVGKGLRNVLLLHSVQV